jgi:hypothetical protein
MRFSIVALLGVAAVAYAQEADVATPGGEVLADPVVEGGDVEVDTTDPSTLFQGPFGFPVGVDKPGRMKDLPKGGPPSDGHKGKDGLPVWHPSHKGVFIDDCDDDEDDKWHWAHKGKKHPKPIIPHHKWTTSTVTATKTKTVFDCPDKVPGCPGKPKTKFTTTTVEVTTTICPVPITDLPAPPPHPPKPTKPGPPPAMPPKPTGPPAPTGAPVVPDVPEVSKPPVVISGSAAQNAVGALAAATM